MSDTAFPPSGRGISTRMDVATNTAEHLINNGSSRTSTPSTPPPTPAPSTPAPTQAPAEVVKLPVKHADGPFGSVRPRRTGANELRRRLIAFDVGSILVGWGLALVLPFLGAVDTTDARVLAVAAIAVVAQWIVIVAQRLHKARIAARRATELTGLTRSAVMAGLFAVSLDSIFDVGIPLPRIIAGGLISLALLAALRAVYASWLRAQRARGRYARDLVLVGTNPEAISLLQLLETHPELGYRVSGVTGDEHEYQQHPWTVPFRGEPGHTLDAVVDLDADGVMIAASALDGADLNELSRELLRHEVHVHLSSGLMGIDHRRLRPLPMAHEPLFYLERPSVSTAQLRVKRGLDVALASFTLLVASPVIAAAALAIKLNDGGPVFFKQRRVGRNCKQFTVYKLRTMVPDAEARLDDVLEKLGNGRDDVLFKLDNDPRRTKVGRFLEATSLDELPQLFNVLNGTMSIVGPRPALPSEVEKFDDELMDRFNVPPGVTGLWQVEARDNPSFSAYRRLDLFYVENWNLLLDLILMMETCSSVLARILRRGKSSRPRNGTAG